MKTTVHLLSVENQAVIRKMFDTIDTMLCNTSWNAREVEKAMEQMLQGDFTTPSFSHHRMKLTYLLIRRQILHLLSLEAQIREMKNEKGIVGTRRAVSERKEEKMRKENEPEHENAKKQTEEITELQQETSAPNTNYIGKSSHDSQRKTRRAATTSPPNKPPPK